MRMGAKREAAKWFLRVGGATAILSGIAVLAEPGNAMAAGLLPKLGMASATHAVSLFATVLFIANLYIAAFNGGLAPHRRR